MVYWTSRHFIDVFLLVSRSKVSSLGCKSPYDQNLSFEILKPVLFFDTENLESSSAMIFLALSNFCFP